MGSAEAAYDDATICVSTGARLHYGLFDVKAPFGGVGMMVDHPRTVVCVCAADKFETQPCSVDRVVQVARHIAMRIPVVMTNAGLPKCRIRIEAAANPHCGLGSGTQLALASALAMSEYYSLKLSRSELVYQVAMRGRRSSIGSIGFFEGGLLAEGGDELGHEFNTSWHRVVLPERWRILLACPRVDAASICGEVEGAAFAALAAAEPDQRAELVRLSEQILRFGQTGDFTKFSLSVAKFNEQSGRLFALHQGGSYNGPAVEQLIHRLKLLGCVGVGQSSWGPTVFAFCKDDVEANHHCRSLHDINCRVVKPQSTGYTLVRRPSTSCK